MHKLSPFFARIIDKAAKKVHCQKGFEIRFRIYYFKSSRHCSESERMKFHPVSQEIAESDGLAEEYAVARQIGTVRVGRSVLFFRAGLKHTISPMRKCAAASGTPVTEGDPA